MTPNLDLAHIMQIGTGFMAAKILLTAVELELFTVLGQSGMTNGQTAAQLADRLGLASHTHDFLDALVSLRLLARDGDGPDSVYRNTADTAAFLDKRSPMYIGGFLEMANRRLYASWGLLTEALKTGKPQSELKQGGTDFFDAAYADDAQIEAFLNAMEGSQRFTFQALVEKFDFSKYQHLCDVGGGSGLLAITAARRHPALRCTSFDLPGATRLAQRRIEAAGLADRVQAVSGSFFTDDLPRADVIAMGNILHDWGLDKKKLLIRKVYEALPAGGRFLIIENIIDDARRENTLGLMVSLNMLIESGEGFDCTAAQYDTWCREAGFRSTECVPLIGPSSVVIASK